MQQTFKGFGILNADGGFWTQEVFKTESLASDYLYRRSRENPKWDLSKHSVVPVKMILKT